MTGKIVSAIYNLPRVAPDEKHSSFLGVLHGKFLIISAIFFCILWPFFGAMPAISAAWGLAFFTLLFFELCFSRVTIQGEITPQRWIVKTGYVAFLLFMILFPPMLSLSELISPTIRKPGDLAFRLVAFYIIIPALLSRSIYAIRAIRVSEPAK